MRRWSSPARWTPRPASRSPSGCSASGRRRPRPMPQLPANRAGTAPAPRVIVDRQSRRPTRRRCRSCMRGIARSDPDYFPLVVANSALGGSSTGAAVPGGAGAPRAQLRREQRPALLSRRRPAGRARADPQQCRARGRAGDAGRDPPDARASRSPTDVLQKRRTLLVGGFGRPGGDAPTGSASSSPASPSRACR